MKTYRYLDADQTLVAVIDEDGVSRASGFASALVPNGATVAAYEPPAIPVPLEVSRFQAKAALALAGRLAEADAAVAASGNMVLQLAWDNATVFRRDSPGIAALAGGIGLDDAALDALFVAAAGIVA